MYKLSFKKRVWIVKQILAGNSYSYVAMAQAVSKPAVFKIMSNYKQFGWDGLKDHKTGRPETIPQTNGKVERFFLTYKTEYSTGTFKNINDYIKHYNQERPHMSLNYKTPQEKWNELVNQF